MSPEVLVLAAMVASGTLGFLYGWIARGATDDAIDRHAARDEEEQ